MSHTPRNYTKKDRNCKTPEIPFQGVTLLDDLDIDILQLCLYEIYIVFGVCEIISFGFGEGHSLLKLPFSRTSGCHWTFPPESATISGQKK